MIELTNLCNLQCITCARNDSFGEDMRKGSMEFSNLKQIVDEVSVFAKSIVLIGLGEILLYKRLIEVVDYISTANNKIELSLATNATLPNSAEVLSAVCDILPTSIMFSIDGISNTYDAIRRGGSFATFVRTVGDIMRQAKAVEFNFNMVVFRDNYKQMIDVLELANELGIPVVHFNTLNLAALPHTPIQAYSFYSSISFRDELTRAHRRAAELGVTLTTFDFETPNGFRKCAYPWKDFYITWDGFLVQCCAQPFPLRKHFGSVFEKGVLACINSSAFIEVRKMWRANRTPALCERCHKVAIPPHNVDA